jgi:Flp pilus assembly protein TadD
MKKQIKIVIFSLLIFLNNSYAQSDKDSAFIEQPSHLTKDTLKTIDLIIPTISKKQEALQSEKISIKHGKKLDSIENVTSNNDIKKNASEQEDNFSPYHFNSTDNRNKDQKDFKDTTIVRSDHLDMFIESEKESIDSTENDLLEQAITAGKFGQIEAATAIYEEMLKIEPNNENALFGLATILHNSAQLEEARKLYTKILTMNPGNQQALNNFLSLVGDESPDEAILELKKLEAINPYMSIIPAQIAMIYVSQKNYVKAIKYLNKATLLSPGTMIYKYNLAIFYDKAGDAQNASKLYRQLIIDNENGKAVPGTIEKINQRLIYLSAK